MTTLPKSFLPPSVSSGYTPQPRGLVGSLPTRFGHGGLRGWGYQEARKTSVVEARWENGSIVHDILPGFKRFVLSYPPFTKKNEKMPIKVFEVDVSVYEGIL